MPRDIGTVQGGTSILVTTEDVLGGDDDGGTGGRVLRVRLKVARGVTQGDPLSPTIFNVVVDAVVRHWVTMALDEAEKRGERGKECRHQAALFYADEGMLSLSDPCWLQ